MKSIWNSGRMDVATYNIHRCIGRDGKKDPDRVVEVIQELNCPIIGLQEVEALGRGSSRTDQAAYFAKMLGFDYVSGPTINNGYGHYGNSLLTRFDILNLRHHDLSLPGLEPRRALDVELNIQGSRVRAVITHLGLLPWERRRQIRHLLKILASAPMEPTIMMGDFNLWSRWSLALRWLFSHFGKHPSPATYPTHFPLLALDRIWVVPRQHMTQVCAHRTTLSKIASDHLPLKLSLLFQGLETAIKADAV